MEYLVSALFDTKANGEIHSLVDANISASVVSGISSAMRMSQPVKASIASVLSTPVGQDLYKQVMTFQIQHTEGSCEKSDTCPSALSNARNKLYIDLSALFLGAHLPSSHEQPQPDAEPSWPTTLLSAFIGNVKNTQTRLDHWSFSLLKNPQPLRVLNSSFTQTHLPPLHPHPSHSTHHQIPEASRDWKASLAEDLLKDTQRSHQAIIQRVSAVCRDLEDRCEYVEAPLRDLTSKLDKMTTECKSSQEKSVELEKQLNQSSQTITALEEDKVKLEQQAQSSRTRVDDLSTRLRSVQKDLDE